MSKAAYVGIDGKARKTLNGYVGVDGVARKVIKGYVGVDGVARPWLSTPSNGVGVISTYNRSCGISGATAVAVGTKIYLFGGQLYKSSSYYGSTAIRVFDTIDETLTKLSAKLPTGVWGTCAVAVGTKIYLLGGNTGTNRYTSSIVVFDTETETATTITTTLPYAGKTCAAAVGTKIYMFGFRTATTVNTAIYAFDTETETIATCKGSVNEYINADNRVNNGFSVVAVGTNVYLFGGSYSEYFATDWYTRCHSTGIWVYDTVEETKTKLSTSLIVNGRKYPFVVGNKAYLFGTTATAVDVFDFGTNTISTLGTVLPESLGTLFAGVGGKAYFFVGTLQKIFAYSPE